MLGQPGVAGSAAGRSPSLAVFAVGAGTRFPPGFPSLLGLGIRAGLSFLHGRVLVSQPVSAGAVKPQLSTVVAWKETREVSGGFFTGRAPPAARGAFPPRHPQSREGLGTREGINSNLFPRFSAGSCFPALTIPHRALPEAPGLSLPSAPPRFPHIAPHFGPCPAICIRRRGKDVSLGEKPAPPQRHSSHLPTISAISAHFAWKTAKKPVSGAAPAGSRRRQR